MKKMILTTVLAVAAIAGGLAWLSVRQSVEAQSKTPPAKKAKTLKPFSSKAELDAYLKKFASRRRLKLMDNDDATPMASPVANAAAGASKDSKSEAKAADESITNNQVAGVDEGGIVKVHGDHLVILRRGRLFTVRVGDDQLNPVSTVNAYGPEVDPSGTWYDEMLISDRTVVVIGYSYQRGGTEVGLFDLDAAGKLKYRSTWHLRSNDYYSSRNYASRLVGGKLVFYAPQYFEGEPDEVMPAVRRWHRDAKPSEFMSVITPERIFRAPGEATNSYDAALHTVTVCSIDGDLKCEATGVVGPSGRVFYVAQKSVFVWTSGGDENSSMLYKLPLDGAAPSAIGVSGSPVDQFSFDETPNGTLDVIVRAEAKGDGMWRAEVSEGDVALLRLRPDAFGDGSGRAARSNYKALPSPKGWDFRNRFAGNYVLYAAGDYDYDYESRPKYSDRLIYATRRTDGFTTRIELRHSVQRIEVLGGGAAVAVGQRGDDLHFSTIALGGTPEVCDDYVRKNAAQGDDRSQGFFYKPDDADNGVLGLPVIGGGDSENGGAAVTFLRNEGLTLAEAGELRSSRNASVEDNCQASCVDWYGDARPIFLRGRVFALLGYELVEGRFDGRKLKEKRRVNFAPKG